MRFVKLCAGRIGSVLDWSNLANDVGCDVKTLRGWMSILEASYVAFLLPPWFENRGKRLVRSPKVYFYDVGLACAILGIVNSVQLDRDPMRGHLFENLVILERMKAAFNSGRKGEFYFFRDGHGNEVDLIEVRDGVVYPTEIKSAQTFSPSFCKGIDIFVKEYGDRCAQGEIVYGGTESHTWKECSVRYSCPENNNVLNATAFPTPSSGRYVSCQKIGAHHRLHRRITAAVVANW